MARDRLIQRVLAWNNLVDAWEDVRARQGAPGGDGVSLSRWGRRWEERLVNLRRAVLAGTYRPAPLKRYRIPKASGGYRHIACPTVTDKVLQRAVLNVLDDVLDLLFLPCSHGYRKGHSVADALEAVCTWRDAGHRWVLDGDIDECFDSFDHGVVLALLREHVGDALVLGLIEGWLRAGRRSPDLACGLPLGSVISPLLCNLTLHELDRALLARGRHVVRYADDFLVLCATETEALAARDASSQAWPLSACGWSPPRRPSCTFAMALTIWECTFRRTSTPISGGISTSPWRAGSPISCMAINRSMSEGRAAWLRST